LNRLLRRSASRSAASKALLSPARSAAGVLFDRSLVVNHGRYVAFQMAEVAVSRHLFADVLRLIAELRPPHVTSTA